MIAENQAGFKSTAKQIFIDFKKEPHRAWREKLMYDAKIQG